MNNWIHLPASQGINSKQAHTDIPEGSYKRELGQECFSGPATHMYHKHPPCEWESISGSLMHHAYNTQVLTNNNTLPWNSTKLLFNINIQLNYWSINIPMSDLVRNADGDQLIFIHQGRGDFYCDYGHMVLSEGDCIIIPKGTIWRIEPTEKLNCILIEATQDHFRLPDKGLVGAHAIFDPAVLITPEINIRFKDQQSDTKPWKVHIKRQNLISVMQYPYNPLDAIGWHGNLMPVKLNWRDIRPLMSHRYHLPPSAHTLFITNNFIISCFVPRPLESDPGALRVPFYHSNDDYDEVIFYHRGNFFSRDNIQSGMITLHPAGLPHGPHPEAYDAGKNSERTETDEVALMIDARYPLEATQDAIKIENTQYINSWKR